MAISLGIYPIFRQTHIAYKILFHPFSVFVRMSLNFQAFQVSRFAMFFFLPQEIHGELGFRSSALISCCLPRFSLDCKSINHNHQPLTTINHNHCKSMSRHSSPLTTINRRRHENHHYIINTRLRTIISIH